MTEKVPRRIWQEIGVGGRYHLRQAHLSEPRKCCSNTCECLDSLTSVAHTEGMNLTVEYAAAATIFFPQTTRRKLKTGSSKGKK